MKEHTAMGKRSKPRSKNSRGRQRREPPPSPDQRVRYLDLLVGAAPTPRYNPCRVYLGSSDKITPLPTTSSGTILFHLEETTVAINTIALLELWTTGRLHLMPTDRIVGLSQKYESSGGDYFSIVDMISSLSRGETRDAYRRAFAEMCRDQARLHRAEAQRQYDQFLHTARPDAGMVRATEQHERDAAMWDAVRVAVTMPQTPRKTAARESACAAEKAE